MSTDSPGTTDVLILLPELDTGGVAKVARILAGGFARNGLATTVAVIGEAHSGPRAVLDPAVRVVSTPLVGRRPRTLFARVCAAPALVALLRRERPGMLLSPGNHVHLFAALLHWASGGESRLVLKLTNPIFKPHHGPVRQSIRRIAFRWMMGRAASVLALSPEAAAEATAVDPAIAGRIRVVTNPYLSGASPSPVPTPNAEPVLLAVGRLTRQKNFELLLQALGRMEDRPWRLVILGSGRAHARLQRLADRLGIGGRVSLVGYTADPSAYYRQAAMLVMTSLWEGLPAAAIEALASGCPVVATNSSPALSRLVRASGAGTIVDAEPRALALAIAALLDAPPPRRPCPTVLGYTVEAGIQAHLLALTGLGQQARPSLEPGAATPAVAVA